MQPEFKAWPKIPRFNRNVTITEKLDGTNACVVIWEDEEGLVHLAAQSRKRIITPASDNFGFAQWVLENEADLLSLGVGHHFGEWYGQGIQRGYGLDERRFALFNVQRHEDSVPPCCEVVPVLTRTTGLRIGNEVHTALSMLRDAGSAAAPGFMKPEGVVVFIHEGRQLYKVLLEGDDVPKGLAA